MKKTRLIYHLNFCQKAAKKCGGYVKTVVLNGPLKLAIEAMVMVAQNAQNKSEKSKITDKKISVTMCTAF